MRIAGSMLAGAAAMVLAAQAGAHGGTAPGHARIIDVTVETPQGPRVFHAEVARTAAQQERGLMFRTNIPDDGGMIFTPYPANGPPREASFWMKNTPSALDIVFIRKDGTIAAIAENAEPYSETPRRSGEPVAAVLEIRGGLAHALGIAPGAHVRWKH